MNEEIKKKIDEFVEKNERNIIADLDELVRIPSVSKAGSPEPNPFGEECTRVLETAMKMAEKHGMTAQSFGNWYGIAKRGSGEKRIGIFSHLDVVEVDDRWTYPQFEVTEKDGWLIGRGVNDDKCAAVIGMYVAEALTELGLGSNITLELYMGLNEEKGMKDLDRYISEQAQPDFSMVPDFLFPVAVGGPGIMKFELKCDADFAEISEFNGGAAGQRVPIAASLVYTGSSADKVLAAAEGAEHITAEKVDGGVKVSAEGKAASGFGAADSVNAIEVLCGFIAGCGVLSGKEAQVIGTINTLTTEEGRASMGINAEDATYGKVTLTPLIAKTEDGKLSVTYSGRFPTTIGGEEITAKVRELASGYEYKESYNDAPWGVDPEDERVKLLIDARNDVTGKTDGYKTGGSTYASKLTNAVNYGPKDFSKCPFLPEGHGMLHGPDEAMGVKVLMDAVRTYIRAVAMLDNYYGK